MVSGQDGEAAGRPLLIPADNRANHLNTLRLAMALLVIWSHSFAIYYGTEAFEPISLLLNGAYNAGNVAVRVFFVISGFLITVSFIRRKSMLDFLRNRVARIYPGFLVAVAFCLFVVVPLFARHYTLNAPEIVRTLGLALLLRNGLPNIFETHPVSAINGALWSIPFEFWCYLAVMALGAARLLPPRHARRALILAVTLGIVAGKAVLDILDKKPGGGIIGDIIGWPYLWFSIAPCFLVGMLVYLYREHIPRSRALAIGLVLAFIASAHVSRLLCDALFPFVTAYATFYVGMSRRAMPDAARFGDFSYGTYLYGFPIQQMLVEARLPFPAYMAAAMVCSLLAGIVSWFLVEKRFLSRKRRREFSAPADRAAAASGR